jgi:hypothetical protein
MPGNGSSGNESQQAGAAAQFQLFLRPPQYQPGNDFKLWLSRFNNFTANVCDADRKRILFSFLDESAYRAAVNLEISDDASYASACQLLQARFQPSVSDTDKQAQFFALTQQEGQSVTDFADSLRSASSRAFPDMDASARQQLLSGKFLSGLRDATVRVQTQLKGTPDSFQELLKMAQLVEAINSQSRESCTAAAAVAAEDQQVMAVGIHQTLKELSEKVSRLEAGRHESSGSRGGGRLGRRSVKCWNCGQTGHTQRFCRNAPQGNDRGMSHAGSSFHH